MQNKAQNVGNQNAKYSPLLSGVVFWISREQREDSEMLEEAQKLGESRRAGRGMSAMDVWGKQRKAEARQLSWEEEEEKESLFDCV